MDMRKTIMKKVVASEFARLVKNLPTGKELCFATFVPQGSENPDDAEDWWVAQRVALGKEEYTILHHCGGLTSRALVFDYPNELDDDSVKDFLEYSECDRDGYVNVEFPLPKEEKIEVKTVYGQIKPEIERLLEVYSDNSEIKIHRGEITGIRAYKGSINVMFSPSHSVPLSELTDDEIIEAYDALLEVINGE